VAWGNPMCSSAEHSQWAFRVNNVVSLGILTLGLADASSLMLPRRLGAILQTSKLILVTANPSSLRQ
jgi:hypothetical protein